MNYLYIIILSFTLLTHSLFCSTASTHDHLRRTVSFPDRVVKMKWSKQQELLAVLCLNMDDAPTTNLYVCEGGELQHQLKLPFRIATGFTWSPYTNELYVVGWDKTGAGEYTSQLAIYDPNSSTTPKRIVSLGSHRNKSKVVKSISADLIAIGYSQLNRRAKTNPAIDILDLATRYPLAHRISIATLAQLLRAQNCTTSSEFLGIFSLFVRDSQTTDAQKVLGCEGYVFKNIAGINLETIEWKIIHDQHVVTCTPEQNLSPTTATISKVLFDPTLGNTVLKHCSFSNQCKTEVYDRNGCVVSRHADTTRLSIAPNGKIVFVSKRKYWNPFEKKWKKLPFESASHLAVNNHTISFAHANQVCHVAVLPKGNIIRQLCYREQTGRFAPSLRTRSLIPKAKASSAAKDNQASINSLAANSTSKD